MARITKIEVAQSQSRKTRVAAYCRVSTDQEEQLLSLETQKAHYETWIKANPSWEYAGLYYDEGISGTKLANRPALNRLIADCEHGLIDYVITKSISRFARNTTICLEIVRKLLALNIPIFFEKENINTATMDSELMLSIMSSLAESESVSISENNKWGIKHRFKNGTYKCAYPPYGYDWNSEQGEMVVNREQAEVVKYIFKQILAGVGTNEIAKALTAQGVPTKKGGKWTGHTINGIAKNEKYMGACLFQKTYTDSHFNRHRNVGEIEQYYVEDHHEAIISKETFDKANALIERRRKEKGITKESSKYSKRYPLSGKVICGECGGSFKRKTCQKKVVLACTRHIEDIKSCSMKYVDLESVELAFATLMNKLIYGRVKVVKKFYEEIQVGNKADSLLKIHNLEQEIESIAEKKSTIRNLFASGIIEPGIYTQETNVLVGEIEKLTAEKNALAYQASSEISHIEETKKLLTFLEKAKMLDGFDEEVFEEYVEKIVVKSRTELEFHLRCGLQLTERIE